MIPRPAADTPARPVQRQLVIAPSVKAAERIADFIVGVICEQRQLIQYFRVYLTALDDEQSSSVRMHGIGWVANTRMPERNKPRDIRSGYPIARDRIFVDRPVPIAIRRAERPGV